MLSIEPNHQKRVRHGQVLLVGEAARATVGTRAAATPAIDAKKVNILVNTFIKIFHGGEVVLRFQNWIAFRT
jgi:hypothetical protein